MIVAERNRVMATTTLEANADRKPKRLVLEPTDDGWHIIPAGYEESDRLAAELQDAGVRCYVHHMDATSYRFGRSAMVVIPPEHPPAQIEAVVKSFDRSAA